jgi:hypothetical protein
MSTTTTWRDRIERSDLATHRYELLALAAELGRAGESDAATHLARAAAYLREVIRAFDRADRVPIENLASWVRNVAAAAVAASSNQTRHMLLHLTLESTRTVASLGL